jgi:hypothetical protein
MTKLLARAILGAAMLAVWVGITIVPASAGDIYVQPPDGSGVLYASQNDTTGGNGNFATVYDDFTLGSTSNINTVKWIGGYFNPGPPGTITGFTVDFWANSGDAPVTTGGPLATSGLVAGNANEQFVSGNYNSYSLNLGTAFQALGGTQYWLSIVPDIGYPPQWGWASGTGGDGISYQDFFGARSQLSTDMAFSLGTSTPEPISMVLMGTFLSLAGGLLSKKKRAL